MLSTDNSNLQRGDIAKLEYCLENGIEIEIT